MPLENKKVLRCLWKVVKRFTETNAASSREWEWTHGKSTSQTGSWYVELEEVWTQKRVKQAGIKQA